jgi:hypothetical protein
MVRQANPSSGALVGQYAGWRRLAARWVAVMVVAEILEEMEDHFLFAATPAR